MAAGYDTPGAWISSVGNDSRCAPQGEAGRKTISINSRHRGEPAGRMDPESITTPTGRCASSHRNQPLDGEYEPGETAESHGFGKRSFPLGGRRDLDGTVELADAAAFARSYCWGTVTGNAAQLENGDCLRRDGVLDCRM